MISTAIRMFFIWPRKRILDEAIRREYDLNVFNSNEVNVN